MLKFVGRIFGRWIQPFLIEENNVPRLRFDQMLDPHILAVVICINNSKLTSLEILAMAVEVNLHGQS
eukprot:Skav217144  [mRNA]  locus=scaffold1539:313413:313613:+ [translate_table: standard]